ncbi:Uncharacterized protein FKW44_001725 [Caligus rogercresseyi]|uniref:Uncharacterized protein n=1 Tax=Caligus rogercresseyi TaxID=217165 RepID=A0A7T8QVT3_CALRO|nr:Uncharacterized protein FKW44_001725 [Caligus rogercresseyi]
MSDSSGSQRNTRAAILKLHAHGQNISQIANALGCTRKAVAVGINTGTADILKMIRNKTVRTCKLVEAVEGTIVERRGKTTVFGMAKEFNVSKCTMKE